jgi:predicted nucleotidyltransferase
MKKAIIKSVGKYGNSGGVYVPSSWIGGEVEVKLIRRAPKPERDIPAAFSGQMGHVVSAFLYGSYARNEQALDSDIDVIVVTDECTNGLKVPENLKALNYDIRIMSREEAGRAARRDALFGKSLEDARALLNHCFLDELKSFKPGIETLRERIRFAESSLEIVKNIFESTGKESWNDLVYPLIMRLKEIVLIGCILENKKYSLGLVEAAVKRKGIGKGVFLGLMKHYRYVRAGRLPPKKEFEEEVFGKLIDLLGGMIGKCLEERKG